MFKIVNWQNKTKKTNRLLAHYLKLECGIRLIVGVYSKLYIHLYMIKYAF